ncbi:type IV pilus secretin PilQ family protein [Herbaspirillum sp. alder98]|uniref:type IV pilus secretin PilQ family protein n=1 Tax=Herbaspirillum sp. alder98 TaxID=2913096 RepID=UPI001CD83722|nr:type IV pilus secretin PilQ family protein [Herbaspirillum sp. alder98]MCA1324198.1 type IV pilus secretin PilQ [Herbaspirillum sp. alder98]
MNIQLARSCARRIIAVTLLLLPVWVWAADAANRLEQIESHQDEQGEALQLRFTRPPQAGQVRSFMMFNPPRLVLDFAETALAADIARWQDSSGLVLRRSLAADGKRTRLQLDLKAPITHNLDYHDRILRITLRRAAATTSGGSGGGGPEVIKVIDTISFEPGPAGQARLSLGLPSPHTRVDVRRMGQRIVADIADTRPSVLLPRAPDLASLATPVAGYRIMRHGRGTRLVIDVVGNWRYGAFQSADRLHIEITPQPRLAMQLEPQPQYRGRPLSLGFDDIEVRTALQLLADFTGQNIVASDSVKGRMSLHLKDVPADQALDIILQTRGLDMRREAGITWIASREEILLRRRHELEQKADIAELEPLQAEVFQLNYQRADSFRHAFGIGEKEGVRPGARNALLSTRGSALVDARTNQLFVTDTHAVLGNIRKLLARVDVAARQVVIEARIVEADDSFSRNLGVKLGLAAQTHRLAIGSHHDAVATATGQAAAAEFADAADTVAPAPAVNLPALALAGAQPGTFAFTLFNAAASRFLNIELSALESDGRGRIVSSPRLVTADQQPALIEQGEEIPYQQSAGNGATSTAFKKANLKLEVTPHITPDGNVILNVDVNKDSRGTATPNGLAINTKHVKTQVQVENGGTVVIGGIYTKIETERETRVPLLGEIPLLGRLFRHNARVSDKTEMLIFLTPRIVGRDAPG